MGHNNWWRHGTCGTQQMACQVWFIFRRLRRTKMSSSAKLKGIMFCYPTTWRDFLLRNIMSTGKLKNVNFNVSHFWGQKRPTLKSEDHIPTMLGPAKLSNTFVIVLFLMSIGGQTPWDVVIERKHFPHYCPLWGKSTGHRWIPSIRDQWWRSIKFVLWKVQRGQTKAKWTGRSLLPTFDPCCPVLFASMDY